MQEQTEGAASRLLESTDIFSWDALLLGLCVVAAIAYLYVKLWRKRGVCDGCPSNSGNGCPSCSARPVIFNTDPLPTNSERNEKDDP